MIDKNDIRRQRFESWIKDRDWFAKAKMRLELTSNGDYKDYRVSDLWHAFLVGVDFGWHKGFSLGVSEK